MKSDILNSSVKGGFHLVEQKMVQYSHDVHVTIVAMRMLSVRSYYDSQGSQLVGIVECFSSPIVPKVASNIIKASI